MKQGPPLISRTAIRGKRLSGTIVVVVTATTARRQTGHSRDMRSRDCVFMRNLHWATSSFTTATRRRPSSSAIAVHSTKITSKIAGIAVRIETPDAIDVFAVSVNFFTTSNHLFVRAC